MKVGIITYQANHLKTEQVFKRLMEKKPENDYIFYGLPFVTRKKRDVIFAHRPDMQSGMDTRELARQYNCKYICCDSDIDIDNSCDIYLILGAGILSSQCVAGKKILNEHPGIIPTSRGLDAFKWAIYDLDPVGNSLHYIDAEVDAGEVIAVLATPVYIHDTLEEFARRHYEREIEMMANYDTYINNPNNSFKNAPVKEPHMRMKNEQEKELFEKFELYKQKYAGDR